MAGLNLSIGLGLSPWRYGESVPLPEPPAPVDLFASGGSMRCPEGNGNMGLDEYTGWATQFLGSTNFNGWFLADGAMFAVVRIPLAETRLNQRYGLLGVEPGNAELAGIYYHGGSWNSAGFRRQFAGHVRKTGQSTLTVYSPAVTEDRVLVVFKRASNNFSIDWYSLATGTKNAGGTTSGTNNGMNNWAFGFSVGAMLSTTFGQNTGPVWGSIPTRTGTSDFQGWPGEIEACGYVAGNVADATWQAIALGAEYSASLTPANVLWMRDFREPWDGTISTANWRLPKPSWATGDISANALQIWRNASGAGGAGRGSHLRRQATTGYLTITPKGNGYVHGLVPGASSRSIPFAGTSDQNGETVQVQVVDAINGNVIVNWTNCGTVTAGAWSGNVTVPRSVDGWVITQARIASDPDKIIRSADRWGVGWKIGIVGQSQAQIAINTNSETVRSATANVGRVSVSVNGLRTLEGAQIPQVLWREGVRPAGDGWPRFVNQWAASTGEDRTPVMVTSFAQSGTGILELINDDQPGRNWSDLVTTTNWTGTDYSIFLHQWATNEQAFGSGFGALMNALYFGTGGQAGDHNFTDHFQSGFRVSVSPPQRASTANTAGPLTQETNSALINYALAKDAQIAWAAGLGWAHGPHIPDAQLAANQGPHQATFAARGNTRVMERYALNLARGLGYDVSEDPTVAGAQFTSGTRDVIRVTFNLPNGGTLRTDGGAPTGFEVNDGGSGTPTNAGFTAARDGNTVTLTKTSGAWATGTTITYHRGGPLNYGETGQTALLDGVLYETYANALEGHIPVAGGNSVISVVPFEELAPEPEPEPLPPPPEPDEEPPEYDVMQSSKSVHGQAVFFFEDPETTGDYFDGTSFVWNPEDGDGVEVTLITPTSVEVTTSHPSGSYQRVMHGAMINAGLGAISVNREGGLDSFKATDGSQSYGAALNVDPGKTGVPIYFAPGVEGTITKGISMVSPAANGRQVLNASARLHVVRNRPLAGSFAPGESSASKVSLWRASDVHWDKWPEYDQTLIENFPTLDAQRIRLARWPRMTFATDRSFADRWTGAFVENNYASSAARDWMTVVLMSMFDLSEADRQLLLSGFIRMGIDVYTRLLSGGRWYRGGLGGVLAGYKMPLAIAAYMLEDEGMINLLSTRPATIATGRFPEDLQYMYVTQAQIDSTDPNVKYWQDDLGMPEWTQNILTPPASHPKVRWKGIAYRDIQRSHGIAQSLVLHLLPGLKTIYNPHPAMTEYADRICERTFYRNPDDIQGSTLKWGFDRSFTNPPADFHEDCWIALRSTSATPIWDWD